MKDFKMENGNVVCVGETLQFADLWSGSGDETEIFESGSVWIGNDENDMPVVAAFDVIGENKDNIIESFVKVTDIY